MNKDKEKAPKSIDLKQDLKSLKAHKSGKPVKKASVLSEAKGKLVYSFDFGEYATKLAVCKISRGHTDVRNLIVIENDNESSRITENNIKDWRAKIMRAMAQAGVSPSGQTGICTIAPRSYISRQLDIPLADEKDRDGLVSYEMSQLLSLDMESYVFQHRVVRSYESNGVNMCTVWAAAVSKSLCENYYDLLESLKLKPIGMDINVNGFERLLSSDKNLASKAKDKAVAVIDYGMHYTDVSIFNDGRFVQGSGIETGEGKLVSAAKNALGPQITDIHNGNKLIVAPQVIYDIMKDAKTSETAGLFLDVVGKWIGEINTIVKRYNLDHPENPVAGIFIYGGSLQFPWLKAYLEKYLEVPVSVVSDLQCCSLSSKIKTQVNTVPQFVNAITAAVRF